MPATTRRLFIAAGPAATVFASLGAAAAASAPSELLDLGRQLALEWASERAVADSDASDEEMNAAIDVTKVIVDKILALKATTFEELKVKARALSWCHSGDFEGISDAVFFGFKNGRLVKERPSTDFLVADSILFDIVALAGRE